MTFDGQELFFGDLPNFRQVMQSDSFMRQQELKLQTAFDTQKKPLLLYYYDYGLANGFKAFLSRKLAF